MDVLNKVPVRAVVFLAVGTSLGAIAPQSQAAIIFSNVSISGSLAAGSGFTTGSTDIDFTFLTASVGDAQPARSGNIIITYLARSDDQGSFDRMLLSVLGGISGSGTIIFNEIIEDQVNPGIIASYGVTLGPGTPPPPLPHNKTLVFSHPSTFVKVKKTLVLVAADSGPPLDLANVSLVEQRLLPTPGAAALLGLGGLLTLTRRRPR